MIDRLTILQGDCREVMKTLPESSVHCCVTSPPYWGLRDYGTATWEGGDAACGHRKLSDAVIAKSDETRTCGANESSNHAATPYYRDVCAKCGARRIDSQIGLEKTPQEYVATMLAVFREVRRVLRDDGTLWLNLGDTYAAGGLGGGSSDSKQQTNYGSINGVHVEKPRKAPIGLKPKDIVGIPWRVAFALQEDGWYLRSDIIWHKPNPMPESVTDRPTKAHEYLFLLSKNERYYYNAEAIKEQSANGGKVVSLGEKSFSRGQANGANVNPSGNGLCDTYTVGANRNKRSVWTVPTSPYPEAHFATYPPDLIKPCILAGCPTGGTVIDPFGGSSTTGMVALELGRKAVLIELNPAYVKLAEDRCNVTPGFALS